MFVNWIEVLLNNVQSAIAGIVDLVYCERVDIFLLTAAQDGAAVDAGEDGWEPEEHDNPGEHVGVDEQPGHDGCVC